MLSGCLHQTWDSSRNGRHPRNGLHNFGTITCGKGMWSSEVPAPPPDVSLMFTPAMDLEMRSSRTVTSRDALQLTFGVQRWASDVSVVCVELTSWVTIP